MKEKDYTQAVEVEKMPCAINLLMRKRYNYALAKKMLKENAQGRDKRIR
jgi:hypothetical protein